MISLLKASWHSCRSRSLHRACSHGQTNNIVLTCKEPNAVGYQFLVGSDPARVMDFEVISGHRPDPQIDLSDLPRRTMVDGKGPRPFPVPRSTPIPCVAEIGSLSVPGPQCLSHEYARCVCGHRGCRSQTKSSQEGAHDEHGLHGQVNHGAIERSQRSGGRTGPSSPDRPNAALCRAGQWRRSGPLRLHYHPCRNSHSLQGVPPGSSDAASSAIILESSLPEAQS